MSFTYIDSCVTSVCHVNPTPSLVNLCNDSRVERASSNSTSCEDTRAEYARLMASHNRRTGALEHYRRLVEMRQQQQPTEVKQEHAEQEGQGKYAIVRSKADKFAENEESTVNEMSDTPNYRPSSATSNAPSGASGSIQICTSSCTWTRPRNALAGATESFTAKQRPPVGFNSPARRRGSLLTSRSSEPPAPPDQCPSKIVVSRHAGRRTPCSARGTPPSSPPPASERAPPPTWRYEAVARGMLLLSPASERRSRRSLVKKTTATSKRSSPASWGVGKGSKAIVEPMSNVSLDATLCSTTPSDMAAVRSAAEILTEEDKRQVERRRSASNQRLQGTAQKVSNGAHNPKTPRAPDNAEQSKAQSNRDPGKQPKTPCGKICGKRLQSQCDRDSGEQSKARDIRDSGEQSRTRCGRNSDGQSKARCGRNSDGQSKARCDRNADGQSKARCDRNADGQSKARCDRNADGQFKSDQSQNTAEEFKVRRDAATPPHSKSRAARNAFSCAADATSTDTTPRLDRYKGRMAEPYPEVDEVVSRHTAVSHLLCPSFTMLRSDELSETIPTPTVSSDHHRSPAMDFAEPSDTPRTADDKAARIAAVAAVLQGILVQTRRVLPCYYCGEPLALSAYHLHLDFCRPRTETLYMRYKLNPLRLVACEPLMPLPGNMSSNEEKNRFTEACYQGVKISIIPCPDCNVAYRIHDLPDHQLVCMSRRDFMSQSKSMASSKSRRR